MDRFSSGAWQFFATNTPNGTGVTDQLVTWSGTLASDTTLAGTWK